MAVKLIGPTFARELVVAGMASSAALCWTTAGTVECHDTAGNLVQIICPEGGSASAIRTPDTGRHSQLTDAQIATVETVLSAHDPTKSLPDWLGFLAWLAQVIPWATRNVLAKAYPDFASYCQFGNASDAQNCIMEAYGKNLLTDTVTVNGTAMSVYQAFQWANGSAGFSLGMTLP